MRRLIALAFVAAGCGAAVDDPAPAGGPASGTIDISSWNALSVWEPDLVESHLSLYISRGAACGGAIDLNGSTLGFFAVGQGADAFAPGVHTDLAVSVFRSTADASCVPVGEPIEMKATSSTVRIASIDVGGVSGDLSATFPDGSIYSGTFRSTDCATRSALESSHCSP